VAAVWAHDFNTDRNIAATCKTSCLGDFLSGAYGGAQLLRQRLQELPSDGSVSFDKRAELPERKPVANQIGCGGYRGRAGPASIRATSPK
jgi:hypothetical protein